MAVARISLAELQSCAQAVGLEVYGVISAEEALAALFKAKPYFESWQHSGFFAEMEYMNRSSDIFTRPQHFLESCASVVCVVVSYLQPAPGREDYFIPPAPKGYGRVARYAWGRDYHKVLPQLLKKLVAEVKSRFQLDESLQARVFSDAVPILERVLSAQANMGFIGKNSMLIRPSVGSFSFLAEILWNIEILNPSPKIQASQQPSAQPGLGCGKCSRCLSACPTQAFPEPGVLDARKCISYLTIEKSGRFDEWERKAVGDWLFGCDICQEICPFNHRGVQATKIKDFLARETQGPYISLLEILSLSTREKFIERFRGSALMRAGWEQMLRNACAVVGNTGFKDAITLLETQAKNSESQLVREASIIALGEL